VVVAGCSLLVLATLPLVFVSNHTPYAELSAVLFVRGMGLGASIQPTVAAAYATLQSSQVPRATAALNTVRQIGGSIGTALLAVVLQHQVAQISSAGGAAGLLAPVSASERAEISGPLASAFGNTFMWTVGMSVFALFAAVTMLRAERAERRLQPRIRLRSPDQGGRSATLGELR
jgi:hypothetical protein